jgi:large subunit ribosomal protein L11
VTYFLKKAAGIESGAKTVGTQIVGKVTKKQVKEIAEQKMPDLNCDSVESAMAQVVGSARSMGLQVVE